MIYVLHIYYDAGSVYVYIFNIQEPKWPAPDGATKDKATQDCKTALQSIKAYKHCKKLVPVEKALENCVNDRLVTSIFSNYLILR